jgi:hypothetical protein
VPNSGEPADSELKFTLPGLPEGANPFLIVTAVLAIPPMLSKLKPDWTEHKEFNDPPVLY